MFSDIEGFTGLTERLPPDEVVTLLNEYFTAMTAVVFRHGGILDKYIGDAMLMLWADVDIREGARKAVCCALEMNEELARMQEKLISEGRRPFKARIGISSGPVIIGEIGSPQKRELTIIGDAVNTASRLENLNKKFQTDIVMSQTTYERLDLPVRVRSLGIVPIKGRQAPMPIYALLGLEEVSR
jgi:adenylate cyclase